MSVVVTGVDDLDSEPSVVTIGQFDGVHRGHRSLIERAREHAAAEGLRLAAVTFDRHPAQVVRPDAAPPALQTLDQKTESLAAMVDLVVVLPFTQELASRTPREFVETVLLDGLAAAVVVVGANFRFGRGASGDVDTLRELGRELGFATDAVPLAAVGSQTVSSTAVRRRLADGDVAWVADALDRPHVVRGEVVRGDGRGRTIGVPTANVRPPEGLALPGVGVYAGAVTADGDSWPAVVNVGRRPTFGGRDVTVEAHLLDVDVDLYGRTVDVRFERRLRGERAFDGPDELVAQIRADIDAARARLDGAPGEDR